MSTDIHVQVLNNLVFICDAFSFLSLSISVIFLMYISLDKKQDIVSKAKHVISIWKSKFTDLCCI